MNIVIYEKINNGYRVRQLKEDRSEKFRFLLETPVNGRIKLDEEILEVRGGASEIHKSRLADKEYSPLLFTGDGVKRLEGFTVKNGELRILDPDGDYVRKIDRRCEELSQKVSFLEEQIEIISDKIENTIIF